MALHAAVHPVGYVSPVSGRGIEGLRSPATPGFESRSPVTMALASPVRAATVLRIVPFQSPYGKAATAIQTAFRRHVLRKRLEQHSKGLSARKLEGRQPQPEPEADAHSRASHARVQRTLKLSPTSHDIPSEQTVYFTDPGALGLNLATDGLVVSLVAGSQAATKQPWLTRHCVTCNCGGHSTCKCDRSTMLRVVDVGGVPTAHVKDRAGLVAIISAHTSGQHASQSVKARLRFRVVSSSPSNEQTATSQTPSDPSKSTNFSKDNIEARLATLEAANAALIAEQRRLHEEVLSLRGSLNASLSPTSLSP